MKNQNLIIPLYLDTNILIDLLASLEGGFSMMEQITTKNSDTTNAGVKAGAKIGFPNFLEMFKVDLDSKLAQETGTESETSTQRYYTFGSLLYKLISQLKEQKILKSYSEDFYKNVEPGDIIEIKGQITKNPLVSSIKGLIEMTDATILLSQLGNAKTPQEKQKISDLKKSMGDLKIKFTTLLTGFEKKNQDFYLLDTNEKEKLSFYFSTFNSFTRDLSGLEFTDGEFIILGKVIDKKDKLNLLEKSSLSGYPAKTFKDLIPAFKTFKDTGFNVPDFKVEIDNPTIKLIPIAIYC